MKLFTASIKSGRSFVSGTVGVKRQLLQNCCHFLFVVLLLLVCFLVLCVFGFFFPQSEDFLPTVKTAPLHLNAPNIHRDLWSEEKSKTVHATKIQKYPFFEIWSIDNINHAFAGCIHHKCKLKSIRLNSSSSRHLHNLPVFLSRAWYRRQGLPACRWDPTTCKSPQIPRSAHTAEIPSKHRELTRALLESFYI